MSAPDKESPAERTARLERLQMELAYSAARSDIECFSVRHNGFLDAPARWDVSSVEQIEAEHYDAGFTEDALERAVEYLGWLNVLERDPVNPNIVTIKDLS